MGNIQQVSSSNVSFQTWSQPVVGKCLNLIVGMPCGSSFRSPSYPTWSYETTREPAPLPYFKRIQLGDVGYIRRGCFHLLFSACSPLDGIQLGVNVPHTFNQLDVGPIFNTQPRLPGCLSTNTVLKTRARIRVLMDPVPYARSVPSVFFRTLDVCSRTLELGPSISLRVTGD